MTTQHQPPATLPICVIIPAYNRAHLLKRALDSVWSQKPLLPAEVLVVDDGSCDETAEVAERLGARVVRHPENRGLADTRNTGLVSTSQPWVAFLDTDDEWLPDHLDHLWRLRAAHALIAGSAMRCGIHPENDRYHGPTTKRPRVLHSGDQLVTPENIIPVSAAMIKRQVAVGAGGFLARHGVSEDLDLWLRVLVDHTAICSPRVTIIYHTHGEQMSSELSQMLLGHESASEAHRDRTGGSAAPLKRWQGVAGFRRLRDAQFAGERLLVARWMLYILARPYRVRGALELVVHRYHALRRATVLRAEGVEPARRGSKKPTS